MNPTSRGSMLTTRLITIPALALIAALAMSWHSVALASPQTTVEAANQAVMETLQERRGDLLADPSLVNGLINEVIAPYIDFETMARMVLGRHWRSATPEQRQRFTAEFRGFLVRFYSSAVREYIVAKGIPDDLSVKVLELREPPKGKTARVRSEILQPGQQPVSVAYTLYKREEQWKVVDLQFENISLVINYRQSFANKIKTAGLEALIETLAERNRRA